MIPYATIYDFTIEYFTLYKNKLLLLHYLWNPITQRKKAYTLNYNNSER